MTTHLDNLATQDGYHADILVSCVPYLVRVPYLVLRFTNRELQTHNFSTNTTYDD